MVRGLFSNFKFPYASFPSTNLTGDQLVPIFYEAILSLQIFGLKVSACTLDGNSASRKFFKLIATESSNMELSISQKIH
jgi:hypothetical protein